MMKTTASSTVTACANSSQKRRSIEISGAYMDRNDLELYLNNLLQTPRFRDYCPNGLQVQGRRRIEKVATGVTASLAFVEAAIEWGADALFVHHGYFWKNEAAPIVGQKHRRLRTLLVN